MAEDKDFAETKESMNPRVEIDTSQPFESVKDAVDRFGGGGGPWIPIHLLRLAAAHRDNYQPFDMQKIVEQAMQLERELMIKEHQTHNVLKELEEAKQFIESFKLNNPMPESSSCVTSPDLKFELPNENSNEGYPTLMFTGFNQANLNRTSIDLAAIQSSLESLNKKLRDDKLLLEKRTKMLMQNHPREGEDSYSDEYHWRNEYFDVECQTGNTYDIVSPSNRVSFEAEQFKKMTEASRYEMMKAMDEIQRTKNSIKMAEMRLDAARKMEEAAKAVKAIALAGKSAYGEDSSDILPSENDGMVKQNEDICKTDKDCPFDVPIFEKLEDREGLVEKTWLILSSAIRTIVVDFIKML